MTLYDAWKAGVRSVQGPITECFTKLPSGVRITIHKGRSFQGCYDVVAQDMRTGTAKICYLNQPSKVMEEVAKCSASLGETRMSVETEAILKDLIFKQIQKYRDLYYHGVPELSDAAYDELKRVYKSIG